MAGAVSQNIDDNPEFLVLRAVYYRQALPNVALSRTTSLYIAIDKLLSNGCLLRGESGLQLSRKGKKHLQALNGDAKIPMIDIDRSQLLEETGSSMQYNIGISVAHQLRERVRNGR